MTRRLETPEEAAARIAAEATLTAREQAELWARLDASTAGAPAGRRRHAARRALLWAAPAVAIAAGLLLWLRAQPGPVALPATAANACVLDPNAQLLRLPQRCATTAVEVAGDEWQIASGAEVARVDSGAQVLRGSVRFKVKKRVQSQFRVQVSHGEVRVIGTVFQVEQHENGGSVTVSEGVIEFVWKDGTRERVAAGQALHWPRATATVANSAPATTADGGVATQGGAATESLDLDAMTGRLLQLRSQRRHAEAAALLRRSLAARGLSPLQRERISYELGLSLEASAEPSCPHWQKHVARFGTERHGPALAERLARCPRE